MVHRVLTTAAILVVSSFKAMGVEELQYKEKVVRDLVEQVPEILDTYDPDTGRFGEGIWICTDQNRMYPLAVAYAYQHEANPFYKDVHLLEVITKAGEALIDDADEKGQWVFRKKDGSTWGSIWMPWTYSRWIRSYMLIRDDMPVKRREAWEKALTLGYEGITRTQLGHVHNIPAHHAMGLYIAGKALDRPDWCEQASAFLMKVMGEQAEGGYWSENVGPVVGYNFVYLDALGTYYAMSGDERVLPALQKSAIFHQYFTYPDGSRVETIDERNPFKKGVHNGNVAFTFTPVGRAFLQRQWGRSGDEPLPADLAASLLLYGEKGPVASGLESDYEFYLKEGGIGRAAVIRTVPWFICLSAYTAPIPSSRWIQDRQNLVSIYHDRVGLILGGGNTKLQPAWSNFTVGDTGLLSHTPADTDPGFMPKGELYHVPSEARLVRDESGLDLRYGGEACSIRVRVRNDRTVEYRIGTTSTTDLPVMAHLTLIPRLNEILESAAGQKTTLTASPVEWSAEEVGGTVAHGGYTVHLPQTASVHWPALPHNPYRKDGHSTPEEGRIEIRVPLDREKSEYTITIEILD